MGERNALLIRASVLAGLLFVAVLTYLPEYTGVFGQTAGIGGSACEEGKLCVFFLDIGQGDATLVYSPTGVQVLIDGGPDNAVLRELGGVMGSFDRTIDVIIATHPDKDHVSGLIDVLERYNVSTIVRTENENDTATWHALEKAMNAEDADIIYARRGQVYDLGRGAELEVLFPDRDVGGMESNASSIVARLTYGNNSFLFTGDAPKSIEEYLVLAEGEHLQSNVLKVGHHGSRTSTSELFLAEVEPDYAVISAGTDNRYGHPHVEVTDLLFNYRIETKNTAEDGRVYMVSNGTNVNFRK